MKANFYLTLMFLSLIAFRSDASRKINGTVYADDDKRPLPGAVVQVLGSKTYVTTNSSGRYSILLPEGKVALVFSHLGFSRKQVQIGKSTRIDVYLTPSSQQLEEIVIVGYGVQKKATVTGCQASISSTQSSKIQGRLAGVSSGKARRGRKNTEQAIPRIANQESYKAIKENGFLKPKKEPLSTFAIDVDAASYSNFRRFINNGQLPPKDAVRIEEMVNYFKYDLKAPANNDPVAVHTELSTAPWNTKHQLLRIGLKAKEVEISKLPPSNLVFLIDVSGSMQDQNKLPLVKSSLKMLVDQLREKDNVAIVTYAGDVGIKLPSTPGGEKTKIKQVIDDLGAGGGTSGGAGMMMAYQLAHQNFIKEGNNRIILATDGDFNVGISSDEDIETLVSREQESGISISVLGFGMGNYKDSKMEIIADKGHGNYAYIDNITEAQKSMVSESGATLFTVAKDVKVQVEFNPAKVQAYRLMGYENRLLEKEDFNNDKKIGGDMGVGHTVTALYEIIPAGVKSDFYGAVDPLKYQKEDEASVDNSSAEIATIKFRYKEPSSNKSKLQKVAVVDTPLAWDNTSDDLRFASAVAELGMLLRNSDFKQSSEFNKLIARARAAKGKDEEGYRAEFIRLAESVKLFSKSAEIAVGGK